MNRLLQSVLCLFQKLFVFFFGTFNWQPPLWIQRLALVLAWPFRPKKLNLSVLFLLLAGAGGAWWWTHLPEPHKISFTVVRPAPTRLEKDAVVNPLYVRFSGSAASLDKVGKDVAKGISVTPALAGNWRWNTDAELVFTPSFDWEVGKTYHVTFDKNLFAPHVLLAERKFAFDTPYFAPQMKSGEFYEDPTDPKNKQVVVTVGLTHPVDKSSFERHISIKLRVDPIKSFTDSSVKSLGFKVLYKDDGSEAYIRSDTIAIPERDGEALVTLEDGVLSAKGGKPSEEKVTRSVQVPGVENYFKISSVEASTITNEKTYQAERILSIESTASVTQKELTGNTEVYLLSDDPELYKNIPAAEISTGEGVSDEEYVDEGEEGDEGEGEDGEEGSYVEPSQCPLESAAQVTPQILKKSQKLPVTWVPTEQDFAQLHSAKFVAPTGRCLYVKIKKGTKSFGDYPLVQDRAFLVDTKPFTPDIKIMGEGAILSASGDKKLSIMTRNIDAVQFRLFRILPNALHHLTTQTDSYGKFSDPQFNYNFGPEQISEVFTSVTTLPPGEQGVPRYAAFDFGKYLASAPAVPKGLFILEANSWDPVRKQPTYTSTKRLVLLTDLGFLVKEAQFGTRDIFVTSLTHGGGVVGADVQVLGKNGLPAFSGKTDENGHVLLPSLKGFKYEKEPTVYVVQKEGDLSFMPFEKRDRELNFSRFDIGGLYTQKEQESLQSYLFSDRGIYRPGESAHIGVVVKNNDWQKLPAGVPFELSIIDPRGIELKRSPIKVGHDGFVEYEYNISEDALTGSYQVELSLARPKRSKVLLGTASIRVDEFLPDRLKIDAKLTPESSQSWYSPDGLKAVVNLKNLFGTPAADNTIRGTIRLTPMLPNFNGYKEYSFFDPFKGKNSFNETIGDQKSDEKGDVTFDLNLNRFEKAIYQLLFISEGFEKESGRSVVTNISTIINPLPYMIGFKSDGDRSFIKRDAVSNVELIAIDSALKRTSASDLTLELIEKRYVSILTKLENGNLGYQSVEKKTAISSEPLSIAQGGLTLKLPTKEPGNYVYFIKNKDGLVLSEIGFAVVGEANLARSLERNAELKLKLDREEYSPGDDIQVEIQAPYTGYGLITIERNKVYASKWFETSTTSSVQSIKVPEGLEGNGYINVSFVRSLASPEVYMSPLSYGVEPFAVGKAKRTEAISLTIPERITPGQDIPIQISTKNKARTAVFGVDEGILQVARYKTPDPLSHFYRKWALEVNTSQILDLILPEFQLLQNAASTGGDEDALLGRHRNPFKRKGQKPVIFWSGIVDTGPVPTTFKMPTPDYFNGSVKVFAVSVTDGTIGVRQGQVTVQGDIVLTPNVPLAAAPGDEFEVSTVVTNVHGSASKTEVSIETDSGLSVVGEPKTSIPLEKGRDSVVKFNVRANEVLGSSNVKFKALNGGAAATYTLDLSIRPSSPLLTTVAYGAIKSGALGGKTMDLPLNRTLYPDLAERQVSVASVPLGLAEGLRKYLEKYPHGCSEQLASQAYPALVFLERHDLGVMEGDARKSLEKAFTILASRQNEDGSFKLWPGYNADAYLSLHIIRLLIEAQQLGVDVPDSLLTNSYAYLQSIANKPVNNLSEARVAAYAIYILTRSGQVTTSYVDALKGAVKQFTDPAWKRDIASLYMAATYAQLKMDKEAEELRRDVPPVLKGAERQYYEDELSHSAQYLYLTAKHLPQGLKAVNAEFLDGITNQLLAQQYNTVSAALLMLGLNEYQKAMPLPTNASFTVSTSTDTKIFNPLRLSTGLFQRASIPTDVVATRLEALDQLPVFYTIEQTGFDKQSPGRVQNGIEIQREYRNTKGEVITEANLGDDIEVRIIVRSIEAPERVGEVAVSDLFPAGFELQGGSLALQTVSNTSGVPSWYLHFTDAREDRALLYGNVSTSAQVYTYTVKAVSRGTFTVPPIQVESMYDQRFVARGESSRFIVH